VVCHYTNSMFRFCILFPSSEAFGLDNCGQFCQALCELCFLGSITNHLPVSLWSANVWLQTFLAALQTDRCQRSLCVLFLYFGLKSHLPSHVSCPPVHPYHSLPFIVHLKLRSRCNLAIFVSLFCSHSAIGNWNWTFVDCKLFKLALFYIKPVLLNLFDSKATHCPQQYLKAHLFFQFVIYWIKFVIYWTFSTWLNILWKKKKRKMYIL